MLDRLHVLQAGTALGEVKKNKVVPDHALALSVYRNREQLPIIDMALDQALAYLRLEPLQLNVPAAGFTMVEYAGLGLGWINVLPGRINNLFPSARRVRLVD
jgi:NOL1/NOP2/fmu family ribosome biogenesis protein